MKRIIILLFTLLPLIGTSRSHAQWNYVIDNLRADTVDVYYRQPANTDIGFGLGDRAFILNNGDAVTIAAGDSGCVWLDRTVKVGNKEQTVTTRFATITVNGQKFFVDERTLMFGDNPEGVNDIINFDKDRHSEIWHIYFTGTPYWLAMVLVFISFILFKFSRSAHEGGLAIIPIMFMLAAIAIEIIGTIYVGQDMLWWLDKEQYAIERIIFNLVLFVFTLLYQLRSMKVYKGNADVRVWRPVGFAILGVIAFITCIFISGYHPELDENKLLYTGVALAIGFTVLGIILTVGKNIKELGFIKGLLFSIYALIWAIGACVAIALFAMGFFKVFWELIVTVVSSIAIMFLCSHLFPSRTYRDGDKIVEVYEPLHL